jgi:hypothetical protein
MDLRLECFDGKRLKRGKGMVIGETAAEFQDVHHEQRSLDQIPRLGKAANDPN